MRGSDVVGGVVLRIASALRQAGVPVSTGEAIDAARALEITNAGHRGEVRAALRATLIKRQDDVDTFERTFDALIATFVDDAATEGTHPAGPASTTSPVLPTIGETASTSLPEELAAALRDDDTDALHALATRAVDQLAGIGSGSQDSERALLYRWCDERVTIQAADHRFDFLLLVFILRRSW